MRLHFFCIVLITVLKSSFSIGQTYNYYYGNIHAHSSYSDGNKDSATSLLTTPLQDFNYAKQSVHTDFYGISEHNHQSAGMKTLSDYHKGLADANTANSDGSFVALYGMEWGVISGGGHVLIYGYDSLIGWDAGLYDVFVAQNDYSNLWKKVSSKQGAFAYLAHPQIPDYDSLFFRPHDSIADKAVIGMAARSGPAFSTDSTYTDPSTGNYVTRYRDALKQGYHVGIGLDHDTHNSVFGRQTPGRLVVLATSLTRANVLDALRNMRFYSSDDWNTKVDFTINSQPIGSILSSLGSPTISVTVTDLDAELVSKIELNYGIPESGTLSTVLISNTNSTTLTYTHTIADNSKYYYFLKITQADGDIIWTSPIWYTRNDLATAVQNSNPKDKFQVYPNPAQQNITINMAELIGQKTIQIINIEGKVAIEKQSNENVLILDLQKIPAGEYFVKITFQGDTYTKSVIIKKIK